MLNRRTTHLRVQIGLVVAGIAGAGMMASGTAAAAAGQETPATITAPAPKGAPSVGFTVSWLPTSSPVQVTPGQMAQGTFWVTNQTATPIPVNILPSTAVPGNNGSLGVQNGPDPRFPGITYSPSTFVAQPKTTTPITVTVTVPNALGSGVYLIPATVRPSPPKTGNIQVQEQTIALVTFQIPGVTNAHLKPTFIGPPAGSIRSSSHHLPGLPTIQISTSGSQVLKVLNNSSASLYAYNEITATQTPFGSVVFNGHTAGDVHDLRNQPDLFFPKLYRDYQIAWHPSTLGIGTGHLSAYVSYHPNPTVIAQTSTSTEVLVISPMWVLVVIACLALLVLIDWKRTKRQFKQAVDQEILRRGWASRVGQATGSLIMLFIVVVGAFLSSQLVFVVVAAAGVVVSGLLAAEGRRRDRRTAAKYISVYQFLTAVILLAGVATVLLSVMSTWSADIAVGLAAGAAVWTLLAWWVQWWNEERPIRERPLIRDSVPTKSDEHIVSSEL